MFAISENAPNASDTLHIRTLSPVGVGSSASFENEKCGSDCVLDVVVLSVLVEETVDAVVVVLDDDVVELDDVVAVAELDGVDTTDESDVGFLSVPVLLQPVTSTTAESKIAADLLAISFMMLFSCLLRLYTVLLPYLLYHIQKGVVNKI